MELFQAHQQWKNRPADQRFTSLEALYTAAKHYFDAAREKHDVPLASLRVENVDGDVQVAGKAKVFAKLTHWAFGQLASRIGAPAGYLRALPATLAAQNINHGLATRAGDTNVSLLFHTDSSLVLRSLVSDRYERIWNYEVAERLLDLQARGWEPARPDIRVQDDRLPLYVSDHDLFAFIRNDENRLKETGNEAGLYRGLIVENSEVGAGALKLTRFLYREMCGNHIIWGASKVTALSFRHVGDIRGRLQQWDTDIREYLDSSASEEEAVITRAQRKVIASTKEDVLDAAFGKKIPGLSRKFLEAGYDAAVPDQDGSPRTVWGLVQGLTRASQKTAYGDERTTLDRAAGKLLDAF